MEAKWTKDEIQSQIRRVTRLCQPTLLPELSLYLVTESSPWWWLEPSHLAERGIPEPFWAFAWSGGQALARYILDNPQIVAGRDVIDFGCGGGVVALAALQSGARFVHATDIDPWALEAARINLSDWDGRVEFSSEDWIGRRLPAGSLLLLGDMHYESELTERLVKWFQGLSQVTVLAGDPLRGFLKNDSVWRVLDEMPAPMDCDGLGSLRGRARVLGFEGA